MSMYNGVFEKTDEKCSLFMFQISAIHLLTEVLCSAQQLQFYPINIIIYWWHRIETLIIKWNNKYRIMYTF